MKKRFFSLILCAALLLPIVFSAHMVWADTSSDGDGTIYTDPETGVTFVVPENWEEREMDSDTSESFRARFHSLEDSRDLFLYGYLDVWNEMPSPERSGHTRSDVDSSYFYSKETLRKLFVTLFAQSDFTAAADDVQFVRCGKNEYVEITFVRKVQDRTVTFISSMYIENGYGYFFTFGAASDVAIEDYRSVLSSMQVPSPDQSSQGERESNQNSDNIYVEPETEASFAVPERWVQQDLDEGTSNDLVTFISLDDSGSYFDYSCHDLWSEMPESERFGRTRSEIGNDYIYTYDNAKQMLIRYYAQLNPDITIQDVQLITHGNTEYIEISTPYELDGMSLTLITAVHVENGYAHQFIFDGLDDQIIEDFRSVLDSFRVPSTPGSNPAANETHLNSGGIYTDAAMGARFELPIGWVEKETDTETEYPFVIFVFLKDPRNSFQYFSYDLWGQMPFWGRFFLPRSEINSASVYERESMMEALVNRFSRDGFDAALNNIQLVTYGENEFIKVPVTRQADGIILSTTQFIHIQNGRAYWFLFSRQNDEAAADFESVLSSLQVSPAGGSVFSSSAPSSLNIGMIVLEFFLTFFIYALPLLIYRHFIRKSPLSKKRTLIVLTVYEAAAYVLTRIVWFWLTQYKASYLILIFWSLLTFLNMIPRRNSRSTSKKAGYGAAFPQVAGTAVPHISSAVFPLSTQEAPPTPSSVMPASPTPTVPAVPQTPPAAPSAPAAPTPAIPAPQTQPSPAAYAPASAAPQAQPTAPAAQHGASATVVPTAPAASMWPTQYHSAQDMRAGFPKQGEKAQAARSVPPAPQAPSSPAAYAPSSAAPQTQPTAPAAQHGASATVVPTASAASMWPTQYHSAQNMRAGFPKQGEKVSAARPLSPAPQTHADAPFIPAASTPVASVPVAPTSAAPTPAAPTPAVPALQTPPSSVASAPASTAPSAPAAYSPTAVTSSMPAAAAPQTPPAPRIQFCRNCGFRLLEDSKFCSSCGMPVAPITKE